MTRPPRQETWARTLLPAMRRAVAAQIKHHVAQIEHQPLADAVSLVNPTRRRGMWTGS